MRKHTTLSIDLDIINKVDKEIEGSDVSRSDYLNNYLKNTLISKEIISTEIKMHELDIEKLKQKLILIDQQTKQHIEHINPDIIPRLKEINIILLKKQGKEQDHFISTWLLMINRDFNETFTREEFKEILRRWG